MFGTSAKELAGCLLNLTSNVSCRLFLVGQLIHLHAEKLIHKPRVSCNADGPSPIQWKYMIAIISSSVSKLIEHCSFLILLDIVRCDYALSVCCKSP